MLNEGVKKRLRKFLDAYRINDRQASLLAGKSDTYVNHIYTKDRGTLEGVKKIVEHINPNAVSYVLLGQGEMPSVPPEIAHRQHGVRVLPLPHNQLTARSVCRVMGLVGAGPGGSTIFSEAELGYVVAPPSGSEKTIALEVRGESMRGTAEDGWFIYYDQMQDGFMTENIGQVCVVELDDGRILVKKVFSGRKPGTYDLESTTAQTIRDARIVRSAFVIAALPPRTAKFVAMQDE